MKLRGVTKPLQAARRRGGPVTQFLIVLCLLPLSAGCWWDHFHRKQQNEYAVDDSTAAAQYYHEAVANTAPPYHHGVELEIPSNPPPLTNRNPEAEEKWLMTLREAIEIALRNSKVVRQIRGGLVATAVATAYDPAIAETRIQQELARFDTQLIFNLFWGKDEVPLNSNVAPGGGTVGVDRGIPFIFEQDTFGGIAGRNTGLPGSGDVLSLRKQLATGGEITFGFNTDYSLSNVPEDNRAFRAAYDTRIFTSFRQPILQGWGSDVNRAPIIIARLEADRTLFEFKQAVAEMIREVEETYWELVIAEAQYQAVNKSIELNREVVKRLQLNLEAGTGNEAELKQAEQQLKSLMRERINALSGGSLFAPARQRLIGGPVLQVEQQLRGLLGLPPSDGRRIVPVDEPMAAPVEIDWHNTVIDAFTYNPEIQGLKLRVAARREAVKIAADGMKPRLDLFVRRDFNGLGTEFDDSIRMINNDGFGSWTYGMQFQYTLGYRQPAGLLQQRRYELDQERAVLQAKAQEIEHTLAQQFGQVAARFDSWRVTLDALQLAEEQVELAELLYKDGKITLDRWLEVVRTYADSVTEEVADRAAYQFALINLETTKGTIFKFNNIHVHEEAWPGRAYIQAEEQARDRERAIPWHHGKKESAPARDYLPAYGPLKGSKDESPVGYGVTTEPAPARTDTAPDEIALELKTIKPDREPHRSIDLILPTRLDSGLPETPEPVIDAKQPATSDP